MRTGGRSFFVAPELSSGHVLRPTEASDIYSLAITVYTLGNGNSNFFGDLEGTGMRAVQLVMSGHRPSCPNGLRGLHKTHTEYLYSILCNMWQPDAKQRPTAHDLAIPLFNLSNDLNKVFTPFIDLFPHQHPVTAHHNSLTLSIDSYPWNDPRDGVSLKPLPDLLRQTAIAKLIIAARNNSAAEICKAHVNHIRDIICVALDTGVFHPFLFLKGLNRFLLMHGAVNLNDEVLQDIATLLFTTGVLRTYVVKLCRNECTGNRALLE